MHPKLEKAMKIMMIRKALLVLVLGTLGQFALAQADAAKTIAGIVGTVNHFPSAEQKATLQAISQNSANSAAIQTIAQAVHDMQHSATAEHKAMLEKIAADDSATSAEKDLAAIVAGFTHMANDETKARLASIQ
jgi:hypothetical protein